MGGIDSHTQYQYLQWIWIALIATIIANTATVAKAVIAAMVAIATIVAIVAEAAIVPTVAIAAETTAEATVATGTAMDMVLDYYYYK